MREGTAARIRRSQAFVRWISGHLTGLGIQHGYRGHIAATFQSISMEHHAGLVALVKDELYPPAYALLRPQFEAHVRGLWAFYAATGGQLDAFYERGSLPPTDHMVRKIAKDAVGIPMMKDAIWSVLCDYTHTGRSQLIRNLDVGRVGRFYPEDEVISFVELSDAMALMAASAVAHLANARELEGMFERYAEAKIASDESLNKAG